MWRIIGITILLLVILNVVRVWKGIPPTPEPESIPSSMLEEPHPSHRGTVDTAQGITRSLMAEEKLPGLSVAVAVEGDIVWAEGFGWADMEAETPVTPRTRFRIGGVTKTLTSIAVGMLVDRQALDLDAPVHSYLPHFPEKEWEFSTRHLMAHNSGIRAVRGEGGIFRGDHCVTDVERIAVFADEPLWFQPETDFRYSAYGWSIVGAVVGATAGIPFTDFVEREIVTPLGLTHTAPDSIDYTVSEEQRSTLPGVATYYYPRIMINPGLGLHDGPDVDLSCYLPAVGYVSTPSDLVRFGAAVLAGELVSATTLETLTTPVELSTGESIGWALGWSEETLTRDDGTPFARGVGQGFGPVVYRKPLSVLTVGGQVAGCTTTLLTVPEHGLAIAVSSNTSGANHVPRIATRLAEIFVSAATQ